MGTQSGLDATAQVGVCQEVNGRDSDWQSWVKIYDSPLCCLKETHFKFTDIGRLKVEGQKTICHAKIVLKKQEWLYYYLIK